MTNAINAILEANFQFMAAGIGAWSTVLTPNPALIELWPYLAKEYYRGILYFFPWLLPTLIPLDLSGF